VGSSGEKELEQFRDTVPLIQNFTDVHSRQSDVKKFLSASL
jgi:hypothetical protein